MNTTLARGAAINGASIDETAKNGAYLVYFAKCY